MSEIRHINSGHLVCSSSFWRENTVVPSARQIEIANSQYAPIEELDANPGHLGARQLGLT
jgi:hypothetical protein